VAERTTFITALRGARALALTGSGSSEFAGACVCPGLRDSLQLPAESIPAGLILTHPRTAFPALRPGLLVSLARSGDSPESCAALEYFLNVEPAVRHLVITANPQGRLAVAHRDDPRVDVFVLDPRTCDRSLAMTSSFTNMVLASQFLGMLAAPDRYVAMADNLAQIAEWVLLRNTAELAGFARLSFSKGVFLGSGSSYGAAREGALKMLELTAGRITTMAETPLGLRHGPMSWLDANTAVVFFLSSDPIVRAYECDLLEELDRKQIGLRRVIVGGAIPETLRSAGTVAVECPDLPELGEAPANLIYVLVSQLLAFFRSLEEGLKPDSPSDTGVISRVVGSFHIHPRPQGAQPQ
jgi:tagatose-6-phosphate ketose/aldose isomerase